MPSRLPVAVTSRSLLPQLEECLAAAVRACAATQDERGAWHVLPDARIFETALVAHALAVAGGADTQVQLAKKAVRRLTPQSHHPVALAVETGLRSLVVSPTDGIDLSHSSFKGEVFSSRARLMHAVALHAGRAVRSPWRDDKLRADVAAAWAQSSASALKQWSRVELASMHVLLEAHFGNRAAAEQAADVLPPLQGADGSFFANPVSTAMALLALSVARSGSDAWQRCRSYFLDTQKSDGTWRFLSSDVWDTSLMVRGYRDAPGFNERCLDPAVRFLLRSQSDDGGWPFHSGLESDSDTTASALLALAQVSGCELAVDRAIKYLADHQTAEGLWRTWHFKFDPPAEDAVAHIVSALAAHPRRHSIEVSRAMTWLSQAYVRGGWEAHWYRGRPYAVLEIGRVLSETSPTRRAAVTALLNAQNADGGFGHEPGEPSFAGPTSLVVAAAVDVLGAEDVRVARALTYLCATRRVDGSWAGRPEMYGPRPLLSHFQTHTHAFAGFGLSAAARWLRAQAPTPWVAAAVPPPRPSSPEAK